MPKLVGETAQNGEGLIGRQELWSIPTLNQLVRDRYLPHAQANKRSWHIDEMNLRLHILPEEPETVS